MAVPISSDRMYYWLHFTDIADVFKVNARSGYKVLAERFQPIRNGEILILNKQ